MDVSIIIVNYNTCQLTKMCIDSIFKYTSGICFEVLVIDNASKDESYEVLSKDARIKYIYSETNLGFGKANNLGYEMSKGKYLFLLNSDTILLNNAIKYFFDTFENLPRNIACLGSVLKMKDGITNNNSYSTFPSIYSNLCFFKELYLRMQRTKKEKIFKYPFEVDYIIGADLFLRKSVADKLGLFDPDFFMYFEDSEMQYRYHKAGYKSLIINEPQIIHLEGASSKSIKKNLLTGRKAVMYYTGMMIYMGKRYSGPKYLLFRLIAFLYLPLMIHNKAPLKAIRLLFLTKKRILESTK